jgi:transposase
MRGRKMSFCIELSDDERVTLLSWQRTTTMPAGRVRRGRAILLLAEGCPLKDVTVRSGMTAKIVRKWARRFIEQRLEGLSDRPRPGRKPVFSPRGGPLRHQAGV